MKPILTFLLSCFFLIQANAQSPSFNISEVPFSCRGSYLAISWLSDITRWETPNETNGLILKNISKRNWEKFIRIEPENGEQFDLSRIKSTPEQIAISTDKGTAAICFENRSVLRVRSKNLPLNFKPRGDSYLIVRNDRQLRVNNGIANDFLYMFTILNGSISYSGKKDVKFGKVSDNYYKSLKISIVPEKNGDAELAIEEFQSEWVPREYKNSFAQCSNQTNNEFSQWLTKFPVVASEYLPARDLATYIEWMSLISPQGLNRSEGMLMSKNWMNEIWSWDHCFNAMGLALAQPKVAWTQYTCMFDHQSEIGSFPDSYDDQRELWGIVKTPVHGWALQHILKNSTMVSDSMLHTVYKPLKRWTDFWFKYRDDDKNGLPQYNHSFESFDDTSPFDAGLPIEGPELATFLIIQMDVLAEIAQKIGLKDEAEEWKTRSEKTMKLMISRLWNGKKFLSKRSGTEIANQNSNCFIGYVPLLLGKKLPAEIRQKLIDGIKLEGHLLTPFGFTNEDRTSPDFNTESYTRGSVWAPVNLILIDGLMASGENNFAKEVARRYCIHLTKIGFPEKFNALTGNSENDRAYTWTPGVFLTLVQTILK